VVVLVEVLPKLLKQLDDFAVNPRAVLELCHQVERVDHREVLKATRIRFDVLKNVN